MRLMIHSIEYTIHRIREFRKANGYAKFRLATLAGIHEASTRKIDDKEWNPTLETIKALDSIIPPDFTPTSKKTKRNA
jgi:DNA-binding XRE family transcriptional regulator